MNQEYQGIKIADKNIKFRKWKVKDKKEIVSNQDDVLKTKKALVYNCLEDPTIPLDQDEFNYVLLKIRNASLGPKFDYEFFCDECETIYDYEANIDEIIKPVFSGFGTVESSGQKFEMNRIRNQEFYDEMMASTNIQEEKYLVDFILHVRSFNDSENFTFDSLIENINEFDVDVAEDIFRQWEEMRFKTTNLHEVQCPNCKNKEYYEFDLLPEFFPESWNIK